MPIIDHYPETFRDIHDKILEAIAGETPSPQAAAIAVHVTEWIRHNWAGRTLTRKWWGPLGGAVDRDQSGTLIEVSADRVRSLRGRELRTVAWTILASSPALWVDGWRDICRIATTIAVAVESEWSRTVIYVPSAKEVDRAIRDAQVWRDFDKLSTIDRVIDKYGLSQRQIYDIAKKVQDEKDLREQPSLPGF